MGDTALFKSSEIKSENVKYYNDDTDFLQKTMNMIGRVDLSSNRFKDKVE